MTFQVGDRVRMTRNHRGFECVKKGKVGVVVGYYEACQSSKCKPECGMGDIKIATAGEEDKWWAHSADLQLSREQTESVHTLSDCLMALELAELQERACEGKGVYHLDRERPAFAWLRRQAIRELSRIAERGTR